MAKAGDFSLIWDFDSDLNRFIITKEMEEEERMKKEFKQILEDENIKSKREKEIQIAMFFFDFFTWEDAERYEDDKIEDKRMKIGMTLWIRQQMKKWLTKVGKFILQ